MRKHGKVDGNQNEIVEALRACGVSVESLAAVGGGVPDLLCGHAGENWLIEVKMPGEGFTPKQKPWHRDWRGKAHIAYDIKQAIDIVLRRAP